MSRDFEMMLAAEMHFVEGGKGSNLHSGYMEISSSHNMQNNVNLFFKMLIINKTSNFCHLE
jgi:hypothetical protein